MYTIHYLGDANAIVVKYIQYRKHAHAYPSMFVYCYVSYSYPSVPF